MHWKYFLSHPISHKCQTFILNYTYFEHWTVSWYYSILSCGLKSTWHKAALMSFIKDLAMTQILLWRCSIEMTRFWRRPCRLPLHAYFNKVLCHLLKTKSQTVVLPHHSAALAIYSFLSRCSWALINYSSSKLGNSL